MAFQGTSYKMDIVFVIDATGSMTPIMTQVKQSALSLSDEIRTRMDAAGKHVEDKDLRIRVVDFGDYATEGDEAIRQTDFFRMDTEKEKLEAAINKIDINGRGGDDPENGLEALWAAMSSDWVKIGAGEKGRHIIVVMTDALPLHLQERDGCVGYIAEEFPGDVNEMGTLWNNKSSQTSSLSLHPLNKRLILFAPDGQDSAGHTWDNVKTWNFCVSSTVSSASGLEGVSLDTIINEVVRSA